ncbi:unnamed protein product [Meloidogyne enterolobii]|uniref:Uncharacterized protein n=1 Tax=Meloidogyne enterolobii TaxID=390850 RepID=A0ACB1B5E7_MELEN
MTSDWVANRLLLVGNRALMQIQLDQLQQDSATTISPKRLFQLSMGAQDAKQLIFDPFTNTAILLTKNGSLLALNLNNGTETNLELTTGCLKQKTITSIVGEFIWNRAASPQLYALTWNGLMELKLGSDNCPEVNVNWEMFGERGLKAISLFAVADKVFVFATPTDLLVYDRLSASVSQFPIPNPPLKQLLTVSQSSQPFPDRNCFQLPSVSSVDVVVKNDGRTGAVVELPEPKRDEKDENFKLPIECQNISQPQTQYELHFRKRGTEKEKIIRTTNNKTFIEQGVLDKNTDYDVSLGWSNRFWPVQGQSEPKLLLHTGFGFPSAPREPTAFSLSPDTVLLSWLPPELLNAPASEIRYRISQQSSSLVSPVPVAVRPQEGARGHFSTPTADVVSCDENDICQAKVPNLRPSTDYHFWILALHVNRISLNVVEDPEATSVETQAHTREIPGILRLENATSTSLNLRWNTLPGAENGFPYVQRIQVSIQYRQSAVDASWTLLHNSTFTLEQNTTLISTGSQHSFCIEDLRPATTYDYRYLAEYHNNIVPNEEASNKKEKVLITESFFQQVQQARTKAGTPSAPTNVQLINDPKGTWTLRWSAPDSDGGETIQNYAVEFRPNSQSEWEIADRGLPSDKLFWRVTWSESHARHGSEDSDLTNGQFRVRAANSEGFGDFGYTKVNGADNVSGLERNGKGTVWNVLLILLLVSLILCAGAYYTLRLKMSKRRKVREKLHKPICMESIGEQIQQFHQTQMQFSPEVQNELKILPKITPERVKITKQLGIGSFGRVCEGFMRIDRDVSVRVAVKYLKDNSAENKIKFLKEAILMNNFDHPNIVKLLGVNMEQGEHFLVLELMDGGDLLGFLRECRPKKGRSSRLCLRDLIAIAVDVGRGCVHLETYKHVHRDLAARNCLISSKTSPQRVTKIADFGLARSLFVDDYYRDMLPLRWLSPEVITQGLFTSKSDVWAFGVLLWEIITLGEQPYSNRQNTEVLNLLSNGICLERPLECPEELYQVMRSCWTIPAEQRPKFLDIQPRMESIRGLTHFQSRDPFPSGILNGFENSLDSSTSTHESSTTTNGGDSSAALRFEKSENSSSRKHSRFGPKPVPRRQLGQQGTNGTISTTTTNVALNDSAEYELPIRPSTSSFQSSSNHNNHQNNQGSPFFASQFRKGNNSTARQQQQAVAFQNNAYLVDEGSSTEGIQKQTWDTQNFRQLNNNGNGHDFITARNPPNTNEEQQRFGGSVSRV